MKRTGELSQDQAQKRTRRVTFNDFCEALDHFSFEQIAAIHTKTRVMIANHYNDLATSVFCVSSI
jgi:hypothetical protein